MTDDELDLVGTDALISAIKRRTVAHTIILSTDAKTNLTSMDISNLSYSFYHSMYLEEFLRGEVRKNIEGASSGK